MPAGFTRCYAIPGCTLLRAAVAYANTARTHFAFRQHTAPGMTPFVGAAYTTPLACLRLLLYFFAAAPSLPAHARVLHPPTPATCRTVPPFAPLPCPTPPTPPLPHTHAAAHTHARLYPLHTLPHAHTPLLPHYPTYHWICSLYPYAHLNTTRCFLIFPTRYNGNVMHRAQWRLVHAGCCCFRLLPPACVAARTAAAAASSAATAHSPPCLPTLPTTCPGRLRTARTWDAVGGMGISAWGALDARLLRSATTLHLISPRAVLKVLRAFWRTVAAAMPPPISPFPAHPLPTPPTLVTAAVPTAGRNPAGWFSPFQDVCCAICRLHYAPSHHLSNFSTTGTPHLRRPSMTSWRVILQD